MEVWDPNDEVESAASQKWRWFWTVVITALITIALATWMSSALANPVTDKYGNPGLSPEELAVEPPADPDGDGDNLAHPPIPGWTPPPPEEGDDEREATDPWWRNRIPPPSIRGAGLEQEIPPPPEEPNPNPRPHPECTGVCA